MKKNKILGIDIVSCSYPEILDYIEHRINSKEQTHIVTANASMLVNSLKDPDFFDCLRQADIVTADGMSIVWASRILNFHCKQRIAGIDLIPELAKVIDKKGYKIYFLGAEEEVIQKVVGNLKNTYPNLNIVGFQNGYFSDDDKVIEQIRFAAPDLVLVGLGSPKQEKWIAKNKEVLNGCVLIGVGGSFDVLAGKIRRAPEWMQKHGLEWFYRFLQEPGRLWKRYLVSNIVFMYKIFKEKMKQLSIRKST